MSRGKAPFVALRTDIRKEERVRFTADFCAYNEFEALGRYAALWCWCADRKLEDAPDDCEGYAVPDAVVRRFLGPRGVEAILGDGCDELAMGVRRPDGLIYLRGTSDTVDRLRSLRSSSTAGGDAAMKVNRRGSGGRFVSTATHVQLTDQLVTSQPPATASEIPDPRSQIPDPFSESPPSRAIQHAGTDQEAHRGPAQVPPDHRGREARRKIALEVRAALDEARARVAKALGIEARPLQAQDPGERIVAEKLLNAGTLPGGLAVVREELLHVVAMAALEAEHDKRSVQWLTGACFSEGNYRRFAGGTASDFMGSARKPARAMVAIRATPAEIASARKVLERLTEDSGITWSVEDGHAALIVERLRDGCSELELRAVATDRGDEWGRDEAKRKWLTPSTVFGTAKFAEYLATARAKYADKIAREHRKAGA